MFADDLHDLISLLLDALYRRYHHDHHVSGFSSSHSHICKCSVSWSIDKCDLFIILCVYSKCTNRLSDLSVLCVYDIGVSECIQKSSLPVIYMAHYCDHRRSFDCHRTSRLNKLYFFIEKSAYLFESRDIQGRELIYR